MYRHTNKRNVVVDVAGQTRVVLEAAECRDAREHRVGLFSTINTDVETGIARASYLLATVSRKRVVPETLVGAGQWLLVVVMVAMCSHGGGEAQKRWGEPHGVDSVGQWRGIKKDADPDFWRAERR